eukprot:gnl/MRDRNA2_/MRDRNA2_94520_c0_seq1.p1 gnl/MRDRNA2_/MRDRNA2_94520_c0~~gnl/MRDRNA2_/MRDRNA2_94520_c0_seq1.p1  ORF type:complete len:523 (+),score=98.93 gnl/MRDRNA2_/MRDRNA2_94520_c0_seq1:60-1628(+)
MGVNKALSSLFGRVLMRSFTPHSPGRRMSPGMTMMRSFSSSSDKHFDYLVIGGGSGGVASARRATTYGKKVGLIESRGINGLGGTCVNEGCVPKKIMFNAAAVMEAMEAATHFGFDAIHPRFDMARMKGMRDHYVGRLNGIYDKNLQAAGITRVDGWGKVLPGSGDGPVEVSVEGSNGSEVYTADHVLVAVGGYPAPPPVKEGAELCIDSDAFFEQTELPKRVAVVGAGYIAVELAGIYKALGSDTTLCVRKSRPLRSFDTLLSDELLKAMDAQGLKLATGFTPSTVTKDPSSGKLTLTAEDPSKSLVDLDCVMMAIGREPRTKNLGLEEAGVTVLPNGRVQVDEFQQTTRKGVYAVGDIITGAVELTPVAIAAGRRLADRLFGGLTDAKISYDTIPTVVFSHPPIGTIGLTEEKARAKYGDDQIKCYTSTFVNLYYGTFQMAPNEKPRSAMKLVCHGPEEKIVGMHVIGMGADEMLQGFAVAMVMGAKKADLDKTMAIHPTSAEEFVTLPPWGLSGRQANL